LCHFAAVSLPADLNEKSNEAAQRRQGCGSHDRNVRCCDEQIPSGPRRRPSPAMNSLRRINHASAPVYGQPIAAGAAWERVESGPGEIPAIVFCSAGGGLWARSGDDGRPVRPLIGVVRTPPQGDRDGGRGSPGRPGRRLDGGRPPTLEPAHGGRRPSSWRKGARGNDSSSTRRRWHDR
jgi:hypothetical protein